MSDDTMHNKAVKHLYPKTSGEQNFYAMHRWETPNDKFLDPNNGVFHIASKVFNRKANHFGHDMEDSIAAYDKVVPHDNEFDPEFPTNESTIHIKHPGALHRDLGIAQGKKIPLSKIKKAEHSSSPLERKRAQFADNFGHHHESTVEEVNPFMKKYLGEATPVGVKKKLQVRNKGLPPLVKKKETLGSLAKDSALKLAHTAFPTTTRFVRAVYNTLKKEDLDETAHYAVTKKGFRHVIAFKKPQKKPVQGLAVNPHEFVREPIKEISNSLLQRYRDKAEKQVDSDWDKIDTARSIASGQLKPRDPLIRRRAMQDANNAMMRSNKRTKGLEKAYNRIDGVVKEGNTDDGSERMGHVGTDQMAPIQLQKGVVKKMKITGKPPVNVNPVLKQAKGPAYGTGWSPDGYVGSFNEHLAKDASAKAYIDDFQASEHGSLKGKSKEKKRQMAIAAYMHNKDTNESVGEMKSKVFRTFNKYRGGKVPGEGKKHFNDSSSQVVDLQKNKQDRMMEAALRSIKRKEALNEIDPVTGLTLGMMALNTTAGGIITHGVGKAIKRMFKDKKKKKEEVKT